ncbi:galactose mutarotase [Neocloeon triangulifer]|uniref:galactose mutarotase n=1 Tax=Neocloeon triangulifer TaxID=2078957 RepID=UPI00286ECD33|nr:galactose mutarotase [Neocloeon triangulifer]
MPIVEDSFGTFLDEETKTSVPVRRFTLKNSKNVSVQIINYGATITTINIPDKNGTIADINLGFDDMKGYTLSGNPYFGAVVGRVANRIKNAEFSIKGQTYKVTANRGQNHLHGGLKGFDKKIWSANVDGPKVTFSYVSKDGEEGYPGDLLVNATYSLNEDNELSLEMTATCTKPTPVNLTNHAYFNLAGHDQGASEFYNHEIKLNADYYTPAVETIPTGEIAAVKGTAFDLQSPKVIKDVFPLTPENGYDNNFCVIQTKAKNNLFFVGRAAHSKSGRVMEVFTDQPGVQFYTANFIPEDNSLPGKGGCFYKKHGGFCLETQNYPNAVNTENFPDSVLLPGQIYKHTALYKFSVDK